MTSSFIEEIAWRYLATTIARKPILSSDDVIETLSEHYELPPVQ